MVRCFACHVVGLPLAFLLFLSSPVSAGPIQAAVTWGTPTAISAVTDVDTTGTLVYAYNFGPPAVNSATVNGVTFDAFVIPNVLPSSVSFGNVVISESHGALEGTNLDTSFAPYGGLPTDYKSLVGFGVGATTPAEITIELSGLAAGSNYRFQWWTNNPLNDIGYNRTKASAVNDVTLSSNTGNTTGSVGEWAIGTFTALGATQSITFNGLTDQSGTTFTSRNPLISAFQLRLEPAAIPEPASIVILGTGSIAIGLKTMIRRRRGGRSADVAKAPESTTPI